MQQQLPTREWQQWLLPFTPQTKENRASLRTAIAVVVAVLLAFSLHLDRPYWSGMTVVILANIYTGSIIDKALMRIAGTIIGAALGYWLAGYIANSFFLYLLMSFMLVAVAVYYYNFSAYAYAYLLAALSGIIVISELAINPDAAFWVAVWRPVEIGLGVLVSAASAFCLFPNKIYEELHSEIEQLFAGFQDLLAQFEKVLLQDNESDLNTLKHSNLQFKKNIRKATEMIAYMRREIGFKREKIDQFRFLLDSFYNLSRAVFYATSTPHYSLVKTAIDANALHAIFVAINQDLLLLKNNFTEEERHHQPLKSPAIVAHVNQQLGFELRNIFHRIITNLLTLNTVVSQGIKPEIAKKNLISSRQRLQTDADVIKHSIKAGLSVVLALVFWLISNWPGGLNGLISSIVISIRSNINEMKDISIYRLYGCFLGGGLALFSLTFVAMNLYDLIIILFFAVWGFSYFSFRFIPQAYIGLQANIALIITLAQAGGPPVVLAPPLERLGGILIGICASFIVANALWRYDLVGLLNRKMTKLAHYLRYNIKQILAPVPNKPLHDLTGLFWICRGLIETLDTKTLKPRKQQQVDADKESFQQLVLMQATLSHIHENINQQHAQNVLKQLGYDFDALHYLQAQTPNPSAFDAMLARVATQTDLPAEESENALAYLNSLKQLNYVLI